MSDDGTDRQPRGEPVATPFRVGDWLVEPAWNRLSRDGATEKLEPRVMRLLVTLAAEAGRPLSRKRLLDRVWPDVTVNEEALSRAVSQLRRALGDDPKEARYLQTVHKSGYCLVAPVDRAADPAAMRAPPAERWLARRAWPLLMLLMIAVGAALLYGRSPTAPQTPRRELEPLTAEPGREIDPAISPDGKRVAYLARDGENYQLFVRAIGGGGPLRLTRDGLAKGHPTWSPMGDRIGFVAADGDAAAIYMLPSDGGPTAKLIDLPSWSYGLDWSPDGRTLAYSDAAPGEKPVIALIDTATRAVQPIETSPDSAGDVKPAFAPDGRRLAFIRSDRLDRQRIVVADREGGDERVLALPPQQIRGLDWMPDGEALIYSARSGRGFGLWRLALNAGATPEPLPIDGDDLWNPSASRDGRVVVEEVDQDSDVWRADLARSRATAFIRSTADDYDAAYAPDGGRVAFVSERSGTPEIWLRDARGRTRQLTKLQGGAVRQISWSPDGRRLAFVAEDDGEAAIYAMDAAGGTLTALRRDATTYLPVGWAADGEAVHVMAAAAGDWRLERLGLADRKSRTIASHVRAAASTRDGRTLVFVPAGESKLLQADTSGRLVRQFRLPPLPHLAAVLPTADGVYLVEDNLGAALVHRLDTRTGDVTLATRLDNYRGGALSLSPDGRWLTYTRSQETANDIASLRLRP
jgi:Tol biopolymer transport system component/DNA-binding winged helix-turn-helix (wHTH) protein